MSVRRSTDLVFEVPLPDNLANGRTHWRMKAKRKTAYYEAMDLCVQLNFLPAPPVAPLVKPVAEITMRTVRAMDHDNAHARLKWVLDWLQTRGYIVNDRDLRYQLEHTTAPRKEVGITLVLRGAA
jgi:hypothetical protein